jgi:propanol-preferring alcohol dehydrogenase
MTGVVVDVAAGVTRFRRGDRVVVPFTGGDGTCPYCQSGRPHLCDAPARPGITYNGGYGQFVCVPGADRNLVHLPEEVSFRDGAALGCRFMTSFHGVVDRAQVAAGEWVAVYGCGGIGLSAINIVTALGARAIAIDVNAANLALAQQMGATHVLNSRDNDPVEAVLDITQGGANVAIDALGIAETCANAIKSLRKNGRHLQIGITTQNEAGWISIPIDLVVFRELQILGTIGMAPHRYGSMIPLVASGRLTPGVMVTGEIALSQVESIFEGMSRNEITGTNVVTDFEH